jgi:ubiquitin-conjugating enzyme E2 Q
MIFTKSSNIPQGVNEALEDVASYSAGMRVSELLHTISARLTKVLANGSEEAPIDIDDDSDVQMIDGVEETEEEESEEDYDPGFDSEDDGAFGGVLSTGSTSLSRYHISPATADKLDRRIRQDLRTVRFAGFKIGVLSGLKADSLTSVLSISIQAADLGLSEEALQAWDLELNQYIVLLIRYSSGYKTFEAVIAEPAKSLDIAFRIGVSNRYKPTLSEALAAFTDIKKDESHSKKGDRAKLNESTTKSSGFTSIFISSSLNEFVNDQFISLLKIRHSTGIGWDGAKHFFNDRQGRTEAKADELPSHYFEESKPKQNALPDMMYADHLTEAGNEVSFPLIAVQFSMRYLLRCTEFCLVCHDRIKEDFEALKPYVCDTPLCLYQYMSLGFGPSVEHEILTQPYVVDLLVSFCYAAAVVSCTSP